MKVWDRVHCRWVKWHGTRAAWLKLPHITAAAVIACAPSTTIPVTKFHPLTKQPAVTHQTSYEPIPDRRVWNIPPDTYHVRITDYDDCCTIYKHHHKHDVPEPNSFILFLTAIIGIIVIMKGNRNDRRRS